MIFKLCKIDMIIKILSHKNLLNINLYKKFKLFKTYRGTYVYKIPTKSEY